MSHADSLIDWLTRRPSVHGAEIVGWRFEVAEGRGVRVGIRNSELGGPYEGPGSATRLRGSLEVHWADGLMSRSGLDRSAILDPATEIAAWRADAVTPRHGRLPPLAEPADVPRVVTYDPAVDAALEPGSTYLIRMPSRMIDEARSRQVRRIDAVMRTSRGVRTVATSRGFRADWSETSCMVTVWADEVAGTSYGRRSLPGADDLNRLVREVAGLAPLLRRDGTLPPASRGVLFMPEVVQELLGRLLLPNLAGRAIREGRSPFSRADLETGRQVLRSDLDLAVDTTLPLELASAPCSSEGVPAGRVSLIAGGRLASPILDLATAAELGLPPTPSPRGQPSALLSSTGPLLNLDDAIALLDAGVVVRGLPGLHTQQPRRSSYALVAPDAQVIEDGVAGGRCAVRLAGNLLTQLSHPSARLVHIPGEAGVGLLILSDVELLPA